MFDLGTLRVIGETGTGKGPDAIVNDPASKPVFTFNGRSDDATAIDAEIGQVAGAIPLIGRPEFAVADGKGMLFVSIEDKHALAAVDSQNLSVNANWDMPACQEPTRLSMDRARRRLFAVCQDRVMAIVNADSGKVIATVPIRGATPMRAHSIRGQTWCSVRMGMALLR
jgi:DNA-binding beta-propeller fold protein YncE